MLRLSCLQFFGQAVAHDTLLMILKLSPASGENSGFKRQACSAPFVPRSVLGSAMTSIMNLRYSVLHNLIDNFMVQILHSGSCPCSYLWRILLQTSTEISKRTRESPELSLLTSCIPASLRQFFSNYSSQE